MTVGSNGKRLFRRVIDQVWHRGEMAFIREAFLPSFVASVPGMGFQSLGDYRAHVMTIREAFPDIHLTVRHQIAEESFVLTRYQVSGTNTGPYLGRPPTGARFEAEAMTLHRLSRGRIAESWSQWDTAGFRACLAARGR